VFIGWEKSYSVGSVREGPYQGSRDQRMCHI